MLRTLVITNLNCSQPTSNSSPWDSVSLVTPQHVVRCLWNEEALRKFSSDVGKKIITCKAEGTIKGEPLTLREQHGLVAQGTNGGERKRQRRFNQDLLESIDVAVGMKVIATQNVEIDLDITNGARGTIVGIILHPDEPMISDAEAQTVELQCLPLYVLAKLDRTRTTQFAGLDESIILVEPKTQTFQVKCE